MIKNKKGFTLIELSVVMAIIAILSLIVVGAISAARRASENTANEANARNVQIAQEAYFTRNNAYYNTGGSVGLDNATMLGAANLNITLGSGSSCTGGGTTDMTATGGSITVQVRNASGVCTTKRTITLP